MKKLLLPVVLLLGITAQAQQKVIQLYNGAAPGSENWNWNEKSLGNNSSGMNIVFNVSHPALTIFPAIHQRQTALLLSFAPAVLFMR